MARLVRLNDNLCVDKEFLDFVSNNKHIICSILIHGSINPDADINYISSSNKPEMISYLQKNKYKSDVDPFESPSRGMMRVGKMVTKLIPNHYIDEHDITDSKIEEFVNLYKAWFDKSNITMKVVQGDDIIKWYDVRNYSMPAVGSLWNSCMRHEDRLKYLDMYPKNGVKMLIMINNYTNKIKGRALLWDNVTNYTNNKDVPSEINIMDRIYTIFDSDVVIFKRWAEENGYIPKYYQNSKSHQVFDVKGEYVILNCGLKLKDCNLKYYPYLDTFPFYNIGSGTISNNEFSSWDYKLMQANGAIERVRESDDDDYDDDF